MVTRPFSEGCTTLPRPVSGGLTIVTRRVSEGEIALRPLRPYVSLLLTAPVRRYRKHRPTERRTDKPNGFRTG